MAPTKSLPTRRKVVGGSARVDFHKTLEQSFAALKKGPSMRRTGRAKMIPTGQGDDLGVPEQEAALVGISPVRVVPGTPRRNPLLWLFGARQEAIPSPESTAFARSGGAKTSMERYADFFQVTDRVEIGVGGSTWRSMDSAGRERPRSSIFKNANLGAKGAFFTDACAAWCCKRLVQRNDHPDALVAQWLRQPTRASGEIRYLHAAS